MILEGMVLHLPRPRFRVTVCAIGGKVSRTLEAGADEVARLPHSVAGSRLVLEQLRRVLRQRSIHAVREGAQNMGNIVHLFVKKETLSKPRHSTNMVP